jgi:hypothetical protein
MWSYHSWAYCCFRASVNRICGRIMIGLASVRKHNMLSYYDWVVVVVIRQLTQYVVVLWLGCRCCRLSVNTICGILCLLRDDNDNPIIIRPHIVFTDGRQQQPNHNTTTYCVYFVVVVVHNKKKYVVVLWLGCRCCHPAVNTICGRVMIGLSLLSSISKHNMWSYYYWVVETTTTQSKYDNILCLLTEDNKPNHNTTTYCVYWRTRTTTQS